MTLILATLVNFALLVGILFWVGRKPLLAFLAVRSETVASSINEATKLSEEAMREKSIWENKWATAESEAKQQLEEAKASLRRAREGALASAKSEAERIKKESQLAGAGEVSKAKERLEREILEKSVALAQSYLKANLGEKDKQRLVSEYMEIVAHG